MIVDLDNGYWTDDYDDSSDIPETGMISSFILGFSPVVEIMHTSYAKEYKLCNDSDELSDFKKYVSIYNGYGNTVSEIDEIHKSDFTEFPIPQLFPIIAQSDELSKIKICSIRYLEMQWGASKLSKSDLRSKMEAEDKTLMALIERYMNMFTYKNVLN